MIIVNYSSGIFFSLILSIIILLIIIPIFYIFINNDRQNKNFIKLILYRLIHSYNNFVKSVSFLLINDTIKLLFFLLIKFILSFLVISIFFCLLSGFLTSEFLLIYPIVNLFHQDFLNLEFYKQELGTGVLALRVSSIILGFQSITTWSIYRKKIKSRYSDIDNLKPLKFGKRKYTLYGRFISRTITFFALQFFIYSSIALIIWFNNWFSLIYFERQLISWALLFIVDDWAIISDYFLHLKGRVLLMHDARILFFNIFLFSSILSLLIKILLNSNFELIFNWLICLYIVLLTGAIVVTTRYIGSSILHKFNILV